MEPATAALIGAGTAAVVGVGAQFIAHGLAVRRDRRAERRERLFRVIVEAATALYAPIREPRQADPDPPPPYPGTLAARWPHSAHPRWEEFTASIQRGSVLLMVHFGSDHELIDTYVRACAQCAEEVGSTIEHFEMPPDDEERLENVPELAQMLHAGHLARDGWMKQARAYVESL